MTECTEDKTHDMQEALTSLNTHWTGLISDEKCLGNLIDWCTANELDASGTFGLTPHVFPSGFRGVMAQKSYMTSKETDRHSQLSSCHDNSSSAGGQKQQGAANSHVKDDSSSTSNTTTNTHFKREVSTTLLRVPFKLMMTCNLVLSMFPHLAVISRVVALIELAENGCFTEHDLLSMFLIEQRRALFYLTSLATSSSLPLPETCNSAQPQSRLGTEDQALFIALYDKSPYNWLPYCSVLPMQYDTPIFWPKTALSLLCADAAICEEEASELLSDALLAFVGFRSLKTKLDGVKHIFETCLQRMTHKLRPEEINGKEIDNEYEGDIKSALLKLGFKPSLLQVSVSTLLSCIIMRESITREEYEWAFSVIGTRSVYTPTLTKDIEVCIKDPREQCAVEEKMLQNTVKTPTSQLAFGELAKECLTSTGTFEYLNRKTQATEKNGALNLSLILLQNPEFYVQKCTGSSPEPRNQHLGNNNTTSTCDYDMYTATTWKEMNENYIHVAFFEPSTRHIALVKASPLKVSQHSSVDDSKVSRILSTFTKAVLKNKKDSNVTSFHASHIKTAGFFESTCALAPFFDLLNHSDEAVCSVHWGLTLPFDSCTTSEVSKPKSKHEKKPKTNKAETTETTGKKCSEKSSSRAVSSVLSSLSMPFSGLSSVSKSLFTLPEYLLRLQPGSVVPYPGAEAFISYGLLSGTQLLQRYGFSLERNCHDTLRLDMQALNKTFERKCVLFETALRKESKVDPTELGIKSVPRGQTRASNIPASVLARRKNLASCQLELDKQVHYDEKKVKEGNANAWAVLTSHRQSILEVCGISTLSQNALHVFHICQTGLSWDLFAFFSASAMATELLKTQFSSIAPAVLRERTTARSKTTDLAPPNLKENSYERIGQAILADSFASLKHKTVTVSAWCNFVHEMLEQVFEKLLIDPPIAKKDAENSAFPMPEQLQSRIEYLQTFLPTLLNQKIDYTRLTSYQQYLTRVTIHNKLSLIKTSLNTLQNTPILE